MNRVSVSSSNIVSIGYDTQNRVLEVEFKDGSVYQYTNVPPSEYEGIMASSSHGSYLNDHIKPNYPYTKIN